MSTAAIATTILMICGSGGTDKDFDCYDYYVNCTVNLKPEPTLKEFEICKRNEKSGIKRIEKLKDTK